MPDLRSGYNLIRVPIGADEGFSSVICERSESIHWRNEKKEWIASSLRSSQ
jgi:hypothetical protein